LANSHWWLANDNVLTLLLLAFIFQIWDLADPDGKGYLDKQVK
jgi:hypothetical protein